MTDETAALVARMNADSLHSMRLGTGTYVSLRSSDVLALIAAYEAEKERADRAERFCARASTAAGEHGVCADAVSLRGELASARAFIARAVEAIEQARTFADLQRRHRATDCACASCRRENDYVDSLAALAADLRKVGDSV